MVDWTSDGHYWHKIVEGKKVYQHRSIMEHELGRTLLPTEKVDHRNGDGLDNRKI